MTLFPESTIMPRLTLSCRRHSWLSASGRAWRVLDETLSITTWKLPAIPSRNIMMTTWPKRERRTWRRSPYRSRSGNLYVWGVFSKSSARDHFYSLWARDLQLFTREYPLCWTGLRKTALFTFRIWLFIFYCLCIGK